MATSYGMLGYGAPAPQGAAPIDRYGYVRQPTLRVPTGPATRLRYGRSYRAASAAQKANRATDRYSGRGLYSGSGRYRRRRRRFRRYRKRRRRWRGRGMYHGRGGFWGDLWKATKTPLLNVAQAGLGAIPVVGGIAGNAFGAIRKATGIGSYNTRTNQLVAGGGNQFEAPSFSPVDDTGAVVISHREFVGNVYGPSAGKDFETQHWDLNPGLEATFPWLAQIAANFEEYELKQLMFTFKTTVSEFTTTTGVTGTVLTATQYDPHSKKFEDLNTMLQTFGGSSAKATENLISGVECDPAKLAGAPGKYIRTSDLENERDKKEYDLGRFVMALSDFPQALHDQAIGQLWVSYTVELRRPRVFTGQGNAISRDVWYLGVGQQTSPPTPIPWPMCPIADNSSTIQPYDHLGVSCKLIADVPTANLFRNSQNTIGVKIDVPRDVNGNAIKWGIAYLDPPAMNGGFVPPNDVPYYGPKNALSASGGDGIFQDSDTSQHLGALYLPAVLPWKGNGTGGWTNLPSNSTKNDSSGLSCLFPARFSGNLRVTLKYQFNCAVALHFVAAQGVGNVEGIHDMVTGCIPGTCTRDPVPAGSAPGTQGTLNRKMGAAVPNGATCMTASRTGSEFRSDVTAPTGSNTGGTFQSGPSRGWSCEFHIRVDPASGGVNNELLINAIFCSVIKSSTTAGPASGTTTYGPVVAGQLVNAEIVVEEYNATQVNAHDVPTIVNDQSEVMMLQDRSLDLE